MSLRLLARARGFALGLLAASLLLGPAVAQVATVTGVVPVTGGGTGAGSFNAHGIAIAEGVNPFTSVGCAAGLALVGNSGDPSCQALGLGGLAAQAADTAVMNATGAAAAPAAVALPSCSTASSALTYDTASHALGCHSIAGGAGSTVAVTTQSGATYTLTSSDCTSKILFTSASAVTLTLPDSLPVGCQVSVEQAAAGQVTCAPAAGATLNSAHGFTKTFGANAVIGLTVDTNAGGAAAVYNLTGDGA